MSWSSLGLADEYDALLTRAVAAKERARETNEPGQWLEASQLFQQADAMRSTPETKYELGYAAEHLRQVDLAVELYETCLEQGITGRAREHARAFVDQHVRSLGRLELAGAAGTQVHIGGLARGTLPLSRPIVVFPGKVKLELVDPSGSERAQTIDVQAGEVFRVDVGAPEVAAVAPTPPPPAPARAAALPPPSSPAAERPSSSGAGLGLLITGSVLTVASATTLIVANQQLDSARDHLATVCKTLVGTDRCIDTSDENRRAQAQSDADAIATWKAVRLGTFVGLGVGLVSAGLGAVLLGTSSRRGKTKAPVQADLQLGPRGWSLALGAGF